MTQGKSATEESMKRKRVDIEPTPGMERKGKVIRYHGSSSGYHLVGNIFSSAETQESDTTGNHSTVILESKEETPKEFRIPSVYGNKTYRLRKLDLNDDDLMIVRDATADEEATRIAADTREVIDDLIPRSVIVSLVNVYFDSNPLLPILDREEYMNAFEGKTSPPPSPLLTYSICAYACFLIRSDDPLFENASVKRDEIYRILTDRAAVLFRTVYLVPRIATIQALVLIANQPVYSGISHKNWILAGMAVRMAQDLGLHRTLKTVDAADFNKKRKRIWYSVYVTDRWCCAIMGRPLAIADSDCDVELSLTDTLYPNEDLTTFFSFVKLSEILGDVLCHVYSARAKAQGYLTKAMEQTVSGLQRMLEQWYANVPEIYAQADPRWTLNSVLLCDYSLVAQAVYCFGKGRPAHAFYSK
ncbi:hypothetical protein G6F47_005754 [Rhizopus delemar]|nr:hypothetical protein G6F52_011528 [Rhizopus delemar]KAG1559888.1 hypothetical protein G6F50_012366 [Rhizopus delemar]KAG1599163.1 hypothetical protein G6F47_005754 [Rhizopus delemar]KAG1632401.1 hypothetical protein G6F45_004134 [Rhizopus arrhizus]KAG1641800.1 hypothetical protein G6F44_005462 [Rhizopus delemar]